MRKYWRLILILATLVSCVFMLIYRKKYENVNSVLVLMNIFKSGAVKNSTFCKEKKSVLFNPSYFMKEELVNFNNWNDIFNGTYVYSSYFVSKSVITLGFTNIPIKNLEDVSCMLQYKRHNESVKSKFSYHALDGKAPTYFYASCTPLFDLGIPYAVTFVRKRFSFSFPVNQGHSFNVSYTACVKPLTSVFYDSYQILEFLVYHSHIGIRHFIIYHSVMSSSVQKLLIGVAAECGIRVELLPWNMPQNFRYPKIKMEPHVINCIFHMSAQNYTSSMFVLDLNSFVSLGQNNDINQLISDNSGVDFSKLWERIFCLEFPDNIFAQDLKIEFKTLSKTNMLQYVSHQNNVTVYNMKRILPVMKHTEGFKKWLLTRSLQKFNTIQESSGVIFSYAPCKMSSDIKKTSLVHRENKQMWRYKNIFYKSCIYMFSEANNLIKD